MVLFGERGNGLHSLLSFRRRESFKRIEQSENLGLQRDCVEIASISSSENSRAIQNPLHARRVGKLRIALSKVLQCCYANIWRRNQGECIPDGFFLFFRGMRATRGLHRRKCPGIPSPHVGFLQAGYRMKSRG